MPFDGKVSDYFETKPAPVYDRDNPPPTMAEAVRMAVADVEAQERAGIKYNYWNCGRCTAGAVCRRLGAEDPMEWGSFGEDWLAVLQALSRMITPHAAEFGGPALNAYARAPHLFVCEPEAENTSITDYARNPAAFKRDMLALADRLEAEGAQ